MGWREARKLFVQLKESRGVVCTVDLETLLSLFHDSLYASVIALDSSFSLSSVEIRCWSLYIDQSAHSSLIEPGVRICALFLSSRIFFWRQQQALTKTPCPEEIALGKINL